MFLSAQSNYPAKLANLHRIFFLFRSRILKVLASFQIRLSMSVHHIHFFFSNCAILDVATREAQGVAFIFKSRPPFWEIKFLFPLNLTPAEEPPPYKIVVSLRLFRVFSQATFHFYRKIFRRFEIDILPRRGTFKFYLHLFHRLLRWIFGCSKFIFYRAAAHLSFHGLCFVVHLDEFSEVRNWYFIAQRHI